MQELKQKLERILEELQGEVAGIRTGRVTSALVEDLEVDYYGAKTPLKAIAAISTMEPRSLLIQPWDKASVQAIEKAIQSSTLGLAPITDRDAIRLSVPALTEERRKDLTKVLGKFVEEARIRVRHARDEALREIDNREKKKEISEDEKFRQRGQAQKVIDEVNKKIEEMAAAKENEIMRV
ncbi:MAG: ribosome recycling factor [Candidatus Sungbacteria bacterium]|nr:ribosome recycling factor [Candidatus Sungbacteria bacterium]